MLGDFPELESLDSHGMVHHHLAAQHHNQLGSQSLGHHNMGPASVHTSEPSPIDPATPGPADKSNQSSPRMDYREGTANITDYSPEWAYPEVSASPTYKTLKLKNKSPVNTFIQDRKFTQYHSCLTITLKYNLIQDFVPGLDALNHYLIKEISIFT